MKTNVQSEQERSLERKIKGLEEKLDLYKKLLDECWHALGAYEAGYADRRLAGSLAVKIARHLNENTLY